METPVGLVTVDVNIHWAPLTATVCRLVLLETKGFLTNCQELLPLELLQLSVLLCVTS